MTQTDEHTGRLGKICMCMAGSVLTPAHMLLVPGTFIPPLCHIPDARLPSLDATHRWLPPQYMVGCIKLTAACAGGKQSPACMLGHALCCTSTGYMISVRKSALRAGHGTGRDAQACALVYTDRTCGIMCGRGRRYKQLAIERPGMLSRALRCTGRGPAGSCTYAGGARTASGRMPRQPRSHPAANWTGAHA